MRFLPRRRFYRFVIYVLSVVLVLTAIDLVLVQVRRSITPGFDTTRITSPVLEDGTVDYLTAIETEFSGGVTDDNNAAPLLLQALGRSALPKDQPPDGITDRLHMPHLPETGDYFVSPQDFEKTNPSATHILEGEVDLWPPDPDPRITQWLQVNEKPRQEILEATHRSRYFMPMNGGTRYRILFEVLLPHLNAIRQSARLFAEHALRHAQSGDFDTARADVLAMHHLARLTAQGPTLVERMVSIGIEGMACKTSRNIAMHAKLDESTAMGFLADSLLLDELPPFTRSIDVTERYLGLDFAMKCAQMGPVEAGRLYRAVSGNSYSQNQGLPDQLFRFIPIPYEASMRTQNAMCDAQIVAFTKPNYAERKEALHVVENWCDSQSKGISSLASSYWLLRLVMPSVERALDQLETARAQLKLTQICWALAAYHADHGMYPESLDLLKSQYLPNIPHDNFAGAPLHYAKRGEGYQLYSVGPNLIDDKGSATKPADDIDASKD
jgi:hypothetical protein